MKEFFDMAAQHGFTLVFAVVMLATVVMLARILASFLQKVWDDRESRIGKLESDIVTVSNGQRDAVMQALLETRKVNSEICKTLTSLDGNVQSLDTNIKKLTEHIQNQPCHMMRDEFVPLLEDVIRKVSAENK